MNLTDMIDCLETLRIKHNELPVYFADNKSKRNIRWIQYFNDPERGMNEGIYARIDNPGIDDITSKKDEQKEKRIARKIKKIMHKSYKEEQFMKLSDLIQYCQAILAEHGDHDIAKIQTGAPDHYKPIKIQFEVGKSGWLKKRTVTEDEEVTVKKRMSVYKLIIEEDIT